VVDDRSSRTAQVPGGLIVMGELVALLEALLDAMGSRLSVESKATG
jgi:hypothetical protein